MGQKYIWELRLISLWTDSTHQRATGNRKYFEYQLAKQNKVGQREQGRRHKNHQPNDYWSERKKYEQLCRGEDLKMVSVMTSTFFWPCLVRFWEQKKNSTCLCIHEHTPPQTAQRQSHLFCRYYDNSRHPKYVIGPVKQEDEWDHPYIVRYHDILSNKEMEAMKELAKPRVRGIARNIFCLVCAD